MSEVDINVTKVWSVREAHRYIDGKLQESYELSPFSSASGKLMVEIGDYLALRSALTLSLQSELALSGQVQQKGDALAAAQSALTAREDLLRELKTVFAGEASPHWVNQYKTTFMRGYWLDRIDAILSNDALRPEKKETERAALEAAIAYHNAHFLVSFDSEYIEHTREDFDAAFRKLAGLPPLPR